MLGKAVTKGVIILLLFIAVVALGLALVLFVQSQPDRSVNPEYVAMGSSFAAGPGISPSAGGPFLCARSQANYPHLLAKLRGLSLLDVSCSGAKTQHILSEGQRFQMPQITAVDERTRLVTITIGGNDVSYIRSIFACQQNAERRFKLHGQCGLVENYPQEKDFSDLEERLVAIATKINQLAPEAIVVFVPNPAVLPPTGTCARLGLSAEHARRLRVVASQLLRVTHNASLRTGSLFLDTHSLGREHNVCAEDSWIFSVSDRRMAAFHPNSAGMRAIAKSLHNLLNQHAVYEYKKAGI